METATVLCSLLKENSLATSDTMVWGGGGEGEANTSPLGDCVLAITDREKEGEGRKAWEVVRIKAGTERLAPRPKGNDHSCL